MEVGSEGMVEKIANPKSRGGENTAIVRTIVMLAHALGMDVIAEGVETAEQLAKLRSLGCEYGQGYFFARPLPSEAGNGPDCFRS